MDTRIQANRGLTGIDLVFTLCGIALLVGAVIVMVSFTIPITQESFASTSWPATSGKVVENRVKTKTNVGAGNKNSNQVIIKYLYTVDGVELLGDRPAIGWGSFWNINSNASRYRKGSDVDVYYNPDAPWRSALRTGLEFNLAFFFSLVMLVLGVLFAFLPSINARRTKKRLAEGAELPKHANKVMGGFLIAFGVISVVFALVMGVVVTVVLGDDAKKASDTTTWTAVEGSVVESGFVETQEKSEKTWTGHIEYRYELDGEAYTSSRYGLGVGRDLRPEGEAVYRNRPGDSVTVYVDPTNPASAVFTTTPLKKSWGAYSIFMLVPTCMVSCGLVFVAVGLVTVLRA